MQVASFNYYLELITEGVSLNLLTHPLLVEGTHLVCRGEFQHTFSRSYKLRKVNCHTKLNNFNFYTEMCRNVPSARQQSQ